MKKMNVVYFVVASLILLLTQCFPDKRNTFPSIQHNLTDSFNSLSRLQQIKYCGSCHKQAYENEMKGPHANAYLRLKEHIEFINSNDYLDSNYTHFVEKGKANCKGCHSLTNLYETILKTANKNNDSLLNYLKSSNKNKTLIPRSGNSNSLLTGDDCLTCHYNGKNVITNFDYKKINTKDCPSFCSPQKSALFSSNNNCVACHQDETKNLVSTLGGKKIESSCIKCHQEYDENGKGTHYMYWRNEPSDKKKPRHLNMFEDISVEYRNDKNLVIVKWANTKLPHPLTLCTEMKAHIEVSNLSGKKIGKTDLLLNRRKEHSLGLQPFYNSQKIPGEDGFQLTFDGTSLLDTILLNRLSHPPFKITIIGTQKAQYWFPDSFQKIIYKKVFDL